MEQPYKSIRPFIGSEDFALSRRFYTELGFTETILFPNLSLFKAGEFGFYLQDAFVEDWINNTMVFMEVRDISSFWNNLVALHLTDTFRTARISDIRQQPWGKVCYVHDPCGILWHFGEFS